jgi:aminoglycoside phosphotransferase (APT) family kinase protein
VVSSPSGPGDAPTSAELVHLLVADQYPQWRQSPVTPVVSSGTDHDIYRLGADLVVRLPRRAWASHQGTVEAEWLPRLAPHLPLAIPAPLALGRPGRGYPFRWSVHAWLPGVSADVASIDLGQAAVDLADFATALRGIPTDCAPARLRGRRGCPLIEVDQSVRTAIGQLGERLDTAAVQAAWESSLAASPWSRGDVWVHGDLLAGNLLVDGGRLSAVIDFGGLSVGDPSCDLQAAWAMFTDESRSRFRLAMAADDDTWRRGRGWALSQSVGALAQQWQVPGVVDRAQHTIAAVLADAP